MRKVYVLLGLGLLAALLVGESEAFAQQVTATVTGQVSDPSGAAIGNAKVTATDAQRGTEYTATTNGEGYYRIVQLNVGTYNVKVESKGFQSAQQSNITLQLNQVAKIDFALQVGNIATAIEVTSAPPELQTEATQLGQVIDERTNTTLPLATRNYVQLTLLAAGSVHPDPSSFTGGQTTASSGRPYVNGNREQQNNFILDGMDNNQVSDNLVGYAPSIDAIQEFNEITQNAPADFGNFMGGIISTSIKSGTNSYHGDLFEFIRNDKLNANSWSNNFTGSSRPLLRWNEFGGTFGGPVKRDKLFFFVDYQGQRFDTPTSIGATSLMTAQERAGNFSQFLTLASPVQLYSPTLIANGQRTPYTGNIIPAAQLNPTSVKIVANAAYPLPTGSTLNNNYLYANHTYINGDQGDAKVDYNLSANDRIFARYSQSAISNPNTNNVPIFYDGFANYPTKNGVLNWTRTLSPSIVNEARFGINYVYVNNGAAINGASGLAQSVGMLDIPSNFLPAMVFTGGYAHTIGNSDGYQLFADTVIQYEDTVHVSKGAHNMNFGFQGWRQRINTFYSGNNGRAGTFTFDGRYTAGPNQNAVAGAGSGQAEADFMLGLPSNIGAGVNGGTWGQRANVLAGFATDTWRASKSLTLNFGLRWELHTPWVEVHNRETNFGMISGTPYIAGAGNCPYNNCNALYNNYNGITNFQPRLGLAWTPMKDTVIRASYTLSSYLEGTGTNLRPTINPPFAHETDANYTSMTYPGSTLDQGFSTLQGTAANPYAGALLRLWDPNVRPALSNQWNLSVQHQFAGSTTLQLAYVGQKSTHLMVPMPYAQLQLHSDGTITPSPFLSGNPQLAGDQISGTASNGNQSYNALQAVLKKSLSSGLEYSVAYTYSKCMTDSSGYYGSWGGQATPTSPYFQNLYDQKAEWGPCYYDAGQILTSYASYDLPFGRGRKIGKNMNKVADAVVGGWQINGILSLHGGFPLTISGSDASGTNSRGARANCLAPVDILGKQNSPAGGYQWFDPSAFGPAAPGTFGTCGVATVRGPGLHNLDLSVSKFFPITEKQRVEFRSEFVNFTNTPILNSPNAGLGSTLGLLQSGQGARQIQFALKYLF
jgi:hypothetical protein